MTSRKAPRIRQLEALMAVITNGSVTAAAADLGISQPAVSRLIAEVVDDFLRNPTACRRAVDELQRNIQELVPPKATPRLRTST